ncbi:MAG: CHASE2 domain-containing protein [Dissulfurispiraceae bacterium]
MKKYSIRIGLGLILALAFLLHAAHIVDYGYLDRMEMLSYDLRLNLTLPHSHDARIVIVDIDEKSLAEEGHWPWSRNKLALLVDNLFRRQASVVGFDVVFAEKDESSGLKILEGLSKKDLARDVSYQSALMKMRGELDYDGIFAQGIKDKPVVLGYYFPQRKGKETHQRTIACACCSCRFIRGTQHTFCENERIRRQPG